LGGAAPDLADAGVLVGVFDDDLAAVAGGVANQRGDDHKIFR
jgi:hypothetical protein